MNLILFIDILEVYNWRTLQFIVSLNRGSPHKAPKGFLRADLPKDNLIYDTTCNYFEMGK